MYISRNLEQWNAFLDMLKTMDPEFIDWIRNQLNASQKAD